MSGNLIITIIGLALFEIISSVDNAVVNANILKTMPEKYRKIFLFWGLLFAVFVVRGLLPFIIVWMANPSLGIGQVIGYAFSGSQEMNAYLEHSKPLLLLGGGIYLFFVFLSWLFLEEKKYAFLVEGFIHRQGVWFYALASIITTTVVYLSLQQNPILALAATIGVSAFFITDGFKKNAEEKEQQLLNPAMAAWSKILYLEILDASFSIDGVIGAFAFTVSVPLIILGNGLGAVVVRELTVRGIDLIAKFAYLKNGAMYAIGVLGSIMIMESFGQEFPFWLAPLAMVVLLGFFLYLSIHSAKQGKKYLKLT
ncbi:DUF475 domain-containing protein [Candidatus Falkowbacteria bacterium]|uniref:DUF475 domain-containing protein n=1 Tax=Candidatus Falkowbacteria bacterium CG10_big_fil_rev_8_21_14_0_10_37_18 TaxID=1974562 RepID=A0A2H0VB27_9BACT|nr:DUF475 domain-containing protein [Candidatus Falkowbacteria bacterium]NCQ12524.1 DUF475 domain-containing protein [Candidatus Falkowbacteria bacterium]OIO05990.1 MAG: hypothetical protein AUJ26_01720 [Candidatus Falkowbacteria bacterium CG1_02_37_21]PIR95510.1 MAG: hypothetical protein COT93_01750 [Candidatus Falkowbacteria bacterium CG10_big_fil_rev_8_21_14_0_10_37_18]